MSVVPFPPRSDVADSMEAAVAEAQAMLSEAAKSEPMRRKPYWLVVQGFSAVLGALVKTTRRWEGATSAVFEARQPFPQDERDALVAQVVEASKAAVYKATRKEAGRMVRALDRRQVARLGLGMGGTFVLGGALMLGGLADLGAGPFNPAGQAAVAWRDRAQHNPDPGPALAAAEVRTDKATGRRFYAGVSLWLDPAGPAPAMHTKP